MVKIRVINELAMTMYVVSRRDTDLNFFGLASVVISIYRLIRASA